MSNHHGTLVFQKSPRQPVSLTCVEVAPCKANSMTWSIKYKGRLVNDATTDISLTLSPTVDGEITGTGTGRNKDVAREDAAKQTLEALGETV